LTTIHANSPYDAVGRLETMVLTGGVHLPVAVIRNYILSAVDLVIQTSRSPDGCRRVVSIAEIVLAGNEIKVNEIFSWKWQVNTNCDTEGYFAKSLHLPKCMARMQAYGCNPLGMWEVGACC
jgi:pilus assembly protein CpaF